MAAQPTGEAYEEEHVHTVYEQIASHFSSTRYKVRQNDVSTTMNSNHPHADIYFSHGLSLKDSSKVSNPAPLAWTWAAAMANIWR